MNYAEKKSFEILGKTTMIGRQKLIEEIVKGIIRDVRHKCAENIMGHVPPIKIGKIKETFHNVVMNTNLDE